MKNTLHITKSSMNQSTEQNLNQSSIFWTKITVKSTLLMLQMGHTNDCYSLASTLTVMLLLALAANQNRHDNRLLMWLSLNC